MIQKNPLLPALLLVAVATVLAAGFAVFGPGTEVADTTTPQERVLVHIDSFTEKRDASTRDPEISGSRRQSGATTLWSTIRRQSGTACSAANR